MKNCGKWRHGMDAGKLVGALSLLLAASMTLAAESITLEIYMAPVLKITGPIGSTNEVQYADGLGDTNQWQTLTNVVLTSSPYLFVDLGVAGSKRFYRTVPMNPDPTNLVWISPGTFTMGSPANELDRYGWEGPQTQVTISKGFWMSKYEVTQGNYQAVMGSNPSSFTGDLRRPVETVTWYEATIYCGALTVLERAAGRLPAGYAYRLPTEAEWEYACRAGTTTRLYYGDDLNYTDLGLYAWYNNNSGGQTHPVGLKRPNKWGLYDMSGNLWEWCSDWWLGYLPGGSVTDPTGPPSGSFRVFRGGSWYDAVWNCRSAFRLDGWPDLWGGNIGFRPVLAPGQ